MQKEDSDLKFNYNSKSKSEIMKNNEIFKIINKYSY